MRLGDSYVGQLVENALDLLGMSTHPIWTLLERNGTRHPQSEIGASRDPQPTHAFDQQPAPLRVVRPRPLPGKPNGPIVQLPLSGFAQGDERLGRNQHRRPRMPGPQLHQPLDWALRRCDSALLEAIHEARFPFVRRDLAERIRAPESAERGVRRKDPLHRMLETACKQQAHPVGALKGRTHASLQTLRVAERRRGGSELLKLVDEKRDRPVVLLRQALRQLQRLREC